jgi:hypothetical protein
MTRSRSLVMPPPDTQAASTRHDHTDHHQRAANHAPDQADQ